MPADFDRCVAEHGKVITKRVNKRGYMHICYDKAGKSHAGEMKQYKKAK